MAGARRTSLNRLVDQLLPLARTASGDTGSLSLRALSEAVDADGFSLMEIRPRDGTAAILAGKGLRTRGDRWPDRHPAPRLAALSEGGEVYAAKGPFGGDPLLEREKVLHLLADSVPLDGNLLVTAAFRRAGKAFTPAEVKRFRLAAGMVNLATRCRLVESRCEGGPVTDLSTFEQYREALAKELSRARRSGGTMATGILSVGPGHGSRADEALLEMARTFRAQLRDFDTLVRYGPTELAFILPDLKGAEGIRVMNRVVGEFASSWGTASQPIYAGLSSYPEDGSSVARLIETAEAAVTRARDESRPGVFRWKE